MAGNDGDRETAGASGGESVDQVDGRQWNALAYALSYGQPEVARRLLTLGARTDTLAGADKMPVALVPLFARQVAGIRLMREAGVDYSKVRHDGVTAVDIARNMEDVELLNALGPKGGAL